MRAKSALRIVGLIASLLASVGCESDGTAGGSQARSSSSGSSNSYSSGSSARAEEPRRVGRCSFCSGTGRQKHQDYFGTWPDGSLRDEYHYEGCTMCGGTGHD